MVQKRQKPPLSQSSSLCQCLRSVKSHRYTGAIRSVNASEASKVTVIPVQCARAMPQKRQKSAVIPEHIRPSMPDECSLELNSHAETSKARVNPENSLRSTPQKRQSRPLSQSNSLGQMPHLDPVSGPTLTQKKGQSQGYPSKFARSTPQKHQSQPLSQEQFARSMSHLNSVSGPALTQTSSLRRSVYDTDASDLRSPSYPAPHLTHHDDSPSDSGDR